MVANIFILTGAGISAASGVPTFRGADGLWEGHHIEDVASPEGFARDPVLVHEFYNQRRAALSRVIPNRAHAALVTLERAVLAHGGDFTLVTQNVDDLHQRAGSERLFPMHGQLTRARCTACGWAGDAPQVLSSAHSCPACARKGDVRPDIIWFGEMPYFMEEIEERLANADLFAAIGTSGHVYPAAGFVREARRAGAVTIELNLEPSAIRGQFDHAIEGNADETVPIWVDGVLGQLHGDR